MIHNKKLIIVALVLILIVLILGLLWFSRREKSPISPEQNQERTYPEQLQKLIDNAKAKQQPIQGGYYLLVNNQMVIAYNEEADQFIVTAITKQNEQIAQKDSEEYFKTLGVSDLNSLHIVRRTYEKYSP